MKPDEIKKTIDKKQLKIVGNALHTILHILGKITEFEKKCLPCFHYTGIVFLIRKLKEPANLIGDIYNAIETEEEKK